MANVSIKTKNSKIIKKIKENSMVFGLAFTIASALFVLFFSEPFFREERLEKYLFDSGVDSIGALICAALLFGSMRQKGEGTTVFKILIIMVSASFSINEVICFTRGVPEYKTLSFIFCLLSKLSDIILIALFYQYVKKMLGFKGKLAELADKVLPAVMVLQILILLSNIFGQVTFYIDETGEFRDTVISFIEDIYLAVAALFSTILIIRCQSTRYQKAAALTFIFFPILEYIVLLAATFGSGAQYGIVLMSLIIMYCVIFNDKMQKLASTQTELNMATDIQAGMLPSIFPAFPYRPEFDIHASMDPAKEVGGDFYDFFMIDEDHLAMVIADVSGKGVPAALFMMSSKILINDHAIIGGTPAEILERVNRQVYANNKAHMFVTVWLGILEISTGKLISSSAGHEYPMINVSGKYELLKDKHGLAIGAMGKSKYKNTEIQLKKGDSIFVYTDGVAEATDANNELFGTERTVDALNAIPAGVSQKELLEGVRAAVDAFVKEAPQFDDLTMLGLKYNGPADTAETEGEE